VLSEPLILAGEQLEESSESISDTAIGILAQVIGFWWGDDEHETFCVTTCEELIETLNAAARVWYINYHSCVDSIFKIFIEHLLNTCDVILQDDQENPSIAILAGVTKGWLGITHLRRLQIRAHVRV